MSPLNLNAIVKVHRREISLVGKYKLQMEVKRAINYSEIAVLQKKLFFRKYRVQ